MEYMYTMIKGAFYQSFVGDTVDKRSIVEDLMSRFI